MSFRTEGTECEKSKMSHGVAALIGNEHRNTLIYGYLFFLHWGLVILVVQYEFPPF
jgi:hypothetical protein